ncbi:MAG: hypothetical protein HCTETUND2_113 [Candidatus Hodgkinia cicadicola]|nr:MAG: hypothetical protein HCTETUND2_113 [Candidatus Hodgkinia cicadicola]
MLLFGWLAVLLCALGWVVVFWRFSPLPLSFFLLSLVVVVVVVVVLEAENPHANVVLKALCDLLI